MRLTIENLIYCRGVWRGNGKRSATILARKPGGLEPAICGALACSGHWI
jgi:hypothetical protein